MSTDHETAVAEDLAPLPDFPGPAGQQPSSAPVSASAASDSTGPVIASWSDLYDRADASVAAARVATEKALDGIARDHEAALEHAVQRPEIPQDRAPGDEGLPFDVAPGSFLAAAACPSCGYGLGGRPCVHVLAGRGAQRTAVAVHEGCAGEAL